MSGRVGDLSKDQAAKLAQLKKDLQDILQPKHTDAHLLRFCRARNFNMKKTEELFRNDVTWRLENQTSGILEDYKIPEVFEKYWIGGLCGCDRDGNALIIMPLGSVDPKGLIKSMSSSEAHKILVYKCQQLYQYAKDNSKEKGRYIEGITCIYDLEGLAPYFLWKPAVAFFTTMMQMLEQHYPESTKKIFITRAPAIFPVAFSLIKPFLQEYTKKKIKILGGSSSKWQKTLRKYIDPDVLPKHWGGNRVDPDGDPKCPSIIKYGGKIPEELYVQKEIFDENVLTKLVIGKGSAKELKYEIRVPESAIRYIFKTDEGEILFTVSRMAGTKGDLDVVRAQQKLFCHVTPADGTLPIDHLGTYVLRFENPSRMKSKTLSYQIEILEPDEEEIARDLVEGDEA